jgi:phosphoserine phosphatase
MSSKGKQKHVVSGTFFFLIENIMNQCGRERLLA